MHLPQLIAVCAGCSEVRLPAVANANWIPGQCDAMRSGGACVANCSGPGGVGGFMPSPVGPPSVTCNGTIWVGLQGSCVPVAGKAVPTICS